MLEELIGKKIGDVICRGIDKLDKLIKDNNTAIKAREKARELNKRKK